MKKYILICTFAVLLLLAIFLIFYFLIGNTKTKQNEDDLAQLLQEYGMRYVEKDDYANAKEYLLRALEKSNISEKKSFSWYGHTYLYLARNARYHNKWQEAEKYYEKAADSLEKSMAGIKNKAKLSQTEKDSFMALCIVYKWIQVCFIRNDTTLKVLQLYPKIQRLKKINKNSVHFANIFPILVGSYTELEKYDQASKLITEGLDMYKCLPKTIETQNSVASLWWSEAKILHLTGKSKKAFEIGSKAYAVLKKKYSNDPETIALITKMLENMRTGTPFDGK